MQCSKCHTQVLYCPCCGELLSVHEHKEPNIEITTGGDLENTDESTFAYKKSPSVKIKTPPQEIEITREKQEPSKKAVAKLILLSGNHSAPEEFFLEQEINLIGRPDTAKNSYPQVDLSFDKEGTISRYHAQIHNREGFFFIEDLGSGNGTFLFDGNQLEKLLPRQLYPLHNRNRIRFGRVLVQFISE